MKYISDEIGNEYRSWYPGTAVLIATQTGSGKSTFVFNRLLKNAVEHSKYLVYICNRRALEEQTSANVLDSLAKELDLDEEELNKYKKYLHIVTYQGCEKRKEFPSFKRIKKVSRPNEKRDECKGCDMELVCEETKRYNDCIKEKFKNEYRARHDPTYRVPGQTVICEEDIMYYVFDEAHYFVADSLFNKDTNYWTPEKLLRKKSISVFLTATPEPLMCYLEESNAYNECKKGSKWADKYLLSGYPYLEYNDSDSNVTFKLPPAQPSNDAELDWCLMFNRYKEYVDKIAAKSVVWTDYNVRVQEFLTCELFMHYPCHADYRMRQVLHVAWLYRLNRARKMKELEQPTNLDDLKIINRFVNDNINLTVPDQFKGYLQEYDLWLNDRLDRYYPLLHFLSDYEKKQKLAQIPYEFSYGIKYIEKIVARLKSKQSSFGGTFKIYIGDVDYSYINPIYYHENKDLINKIVNSGQKWLIFVDSESQGIKLNEQLKVRKCNSVFLSASYRNVKKGGASETFIEIAQTGTFSCDVVIATSVLDCGINIRDENVTNLVISHSDKTEFIQMIGRIRKQNPNHRIDLYIKVHTREEIHKRIGESERKLNFMVDFLHLNYNGENYNQTHERRKRFFNSVATKENAELLCVNDKYYKDEVLKDFLSEFKINKTAYIKSLYLLRCYIEAINESDEFDDNFYLKKQLSWLGMEYDSSRWLTESSQKERDEVEQEFEAFLEQMMQNGKMYTDDQLMFRKECAEFLNRIPSMFLPDNIKTKLKSYSKDSTDKKNLPGKKMLNNYFSNRKIPYQIESDESNNKTHSRESFWIITKNAEQE